MSLGEVASVAIVTDKYSGRPKGFGFVEMASKAEGETAIANLDEKTLKHMTINVVEALPLSDHKDKGYLYTQKTKPVQWKSQKKKILNQLSCLPCLKSTQPLILLRSLNEF